MNSLTTLLFFAWVSFFQSLLPESALITTDQASKSQDFPDLYETSLVELQDGLEKDQFTSVELIKVDCFQDFSLSMFHVQSQAYFARILEVNHQGASLHAIIETNPSALEQAAALDLERKAKGKRSALHGIPILVKDNIATLHEEGMLRLCRLLDN